MCDIKVICISGSSRFIDMISVEKWNLEKQGNAVLTMTLLPSWYSGGQPDHQAEFEGVADVLDRVHLKKIDLCDELLVFNHNGYIGESTQREIDYAKSIGKTIYYHEEVDPPVSLLKGE